MKKLILFLSFIVLFTGTFADSVAVKKPDTVKVVQTVAATPVPVATVSAVPTTPATGWADYFMSPVGIIALIVLMTGYLTKNVPSASILGITITQWISYAIAFAVCFFGWWQGLGIFAGIPVKEVIAEAIGFAFASNGVSTLPVTNKILTGIKAKNPPQSSVGKI